MQSFSFLAAALLALPQMALALDDIEPGAKVAFLGMHFIDTSTEGAMNGVRDDETARLALLEAAVRERFEAEGFDLLDLAPVTEELDRTLNPANCNDCEVRMAEQLGADYSLVGEVQKVSNLILSMNLALRDTESGEFVRMLAVDIRGNTDDAWLRGGRYILNNHFFAED
jgi:hypothetical protein